MCLQYTCIYDVYTLWHAFMHKCIYDDAKNWHGGMPLVTMLDA